MISIFRQTTFLILISIGCALTSCVSVPRVQTPLYEGRQGSISLRVFAEPTKRAEHSVTLEPHIIDRVLKGLYVQDTQSLLESALTNNNPPIQAFTEKEIHFLVPHLIAGLEKATPEEEIIFQVHSTPSHRTLYTTGSLYYVDNTAHVIIHGYHEASKKSRLLSRPSNSFSRPKMWTMSFQPSRAVMNNSLGAASPTSFPFHFAIHLPRLTLTLKQNAQPISPGSPSIHEELNGLRESIQQQHRQIERLEDQLK
jgi:hypothetical protein